MTIKQSNNRPRFSPELLDRQLPSNLESERQVVGTLILDLSRREEVSKVLQQSDFHVQENAILFEHLLNYPHDAIDAHLFADWVKQDLEKIGGVAYLAELVSGVTLVGNVLYHAKLVKKVSRLRNVINRALQLVQLGYADADESELQFHIQVLADLEQPITDLKFDALTCAELDNGKFDLEFLVDGILVAGQPCIMAGPQKSLKTSLLVDLGISLAACGHFLGRFPVTRPARVGLMSGESGLGTLQETARRIAHAAGRRLSEIDGLIFSEHLPRFGSLEHETALKKFIADNGLEVLMIDPAYLAMPSDDPGNLFEQGRLLRGMSEVCREADCGMILAHHTRKGRIDPLAPPELTDIAWSGFQEFARQWLLVGRRESYQPGSGEHRLWLSVGGSAGHGGLWALDISEGTRATPGGRYWQVSVATPDDARVAVVDRRETQRQARQAEQLETDRRAIIDAAVKLPGPETKNGLRDRITIPHKRFPAAFASLVADGTLQEAEIQKSNGQRYTGWILKNEDE